MRYWRVISCLATPCSLGTPPSPGWWQWCLYWGVTLRQTRQYPGGLRTWTVELTTWPTSQSVPSVVPYSGQSLPPLAEEEKSKIDGNQVKSQSRLRNTHYKFRKVLSMWLIKIKLRVSQDTKMHRCKKWYQIQLIDKNEATSYS